MGYQKSDAQVSYVETLATPLGHRISNTGYINVSYDPTKYFSGPTSFNLQGSYRKGVQDLFPATGRLKYNIDFAQINGGMNFKKLEKGIFSSKIILGGNYQFVSFEGVKSHVEENIGREFFKDTKFVNYTAAFTRIENSIKNQKNEDILKFTLGLRWDFFSGNIQDAFPTFQSFLQFRQNQNTIYRISFSNAKRSHFFLNNFLDFNDGEVGRTETITTFLGNQNLVVPSINHFEIGIRSQLLNSKSEEFSIFSDFEFFQITTKNYTTFDLISQEVIDSIPAIVRVSQIQNANITSSQLGFTSSLNLEFALGNNRIISGRLFMTFQKTTINDLSKQYLHDWTPSIFGGFSFLYRSANGFSVFLNSYYTSKQTYLYNTIPQLEIEDEISPSMITSCRLSQKLGNQVEISFNLRNLNILFNGNDRRFGYTDQVLPIAIVGMRLTL